MTKYIILLLLINISVFSKAQVTIGCASEPVYGSILQLKEKRFEGHECHQRVWFSEGIFIKGRQVVSNVRRWIQHRTRHYKRRPNGIQHQP